MGCSKTRGAATIPRHCSSPKPSITGNRNLSYSSDHHDSRHNRSVLFLIALTLLSASGCRTMRRHKLVPESLATCRELSHDGVTAMELGQWDRARAVLDEAVTTSPTDADARRHLAEALWQTYSRTEAAAHMEAAVKIDPRHAPTVVRAGEMLLEIDDVDRAELRAEQAIALDSTLAGGWALRGRVARKRGNSKRALADLQQALRYSPHQTDVLLQVAEVQYELGRPQRCLSTLHRLLDIYPPGQEPQQALWLEGLSYGAMDRHQDAVQSLAAASQRGAPPADLLYQLANAEQSAGQTAAAANTARRVLALDAQHAPSKTLLAQLQGFADPAQGDIIRR